MPILFRIIAFMRNQSTIVLGTTAILLINKQEETYSFVSSDEADITANKISFDSPLGRALKGKKEGDVVTVEIPTGNLTITVWEIVSPA